MCPTWYRCIASRDRVDPGVSDSGPSGAGGARPWGVTNPPANVRSGPAGPPARVGQGASDAVPGVGREDKVCEIQAWGPPERLAAAEVSTDHVHSQAGDAPRKRKDAVVEGQSPPNGSGSTLTRARAPGVP